MKTATRKTAKNAGRDLVRLEEHDGVATVVMTLANGGRPKVESYTLSETGSDVGRAFFLAKVGGDKVYLTQVGGEGQSHCECRGWEFGFTCKHVRAVVSLLAANRIESGIPG